MEEVRGNGRVATMTLCQISLHNKCVLLVIACSLCCYTFGKWATICIKMATMDVQPFITFHFFQEFFYKAYLALLGPVFDSMSWGFFIFCFCLFVVLLLLLLCSKWILLDCYFFSWFCDYTKVANGHFSDALTFRNKMHVF